jgi:hypothetical protein
LANAWLEIFHQVRAKYSSPQFGSQNFDLLSGQWPTSDASHQTRPYIGPKYSRHIASSPKEERRHAQPIRKPEVDLVVDGKKGSKIARRAKILSSLGQLYLSNARRAAKRTWDFKEVFRRAIDPVAKYRPPATQQVTSTVNDLGLVFHKRKTRSTMADHQQMASGCAKN